MVQNAAEGKKDVTGSVTIVGNKPVSRITTLHCSLNHVNDETRALMQVHLEFPPETS